MSEHCYLLDSTLSISRYLYEDAEGKVAKTNLTHVTWEDIVSEVNNFQKISEKNDRF